MDSIQRLRQINEQKQADRQAKTSRTEDQIALIELRETVLKSFKALVDYMDGKVTKTVVTNQLQDYATSGDVAKFVDSVESLHETLKTHRNTDLTEVTALLKGVHAEAAKIPKELPKPDKQKFVDYTKQLSSMAKAVTSVEKAIKAQSTTVEAPIVNVEAPEVNVEAPDLKPLTKEINKEFTKAIKGIKFPEHKTDNTEVEKLLKKHTKILERILDESGKTGGGGGGLGEIGRANVVESTDTPGVFGLVVLNADGSSLSTGGGSTPVDTDNILLESGDALLLETGDLMLTDA